MDWAADGLWRLAQPVAYACRLVTQRASVRTMAGREPRLDTTAGTGRFPGSWRSANLHRLRQHDWFRQHATVGSADRGRGRSTRTALSRLERHRYEGTPGQFFHHR